VLGKLADSLGEGELGRLRELLAVAKQRRDDLQQSRNSIDRPSDQ
jgi:hypothetical protein